jgi:hypothetical protein
MPPRQTKKKRERIPKNPGPKKCSPLASTKKAGKTCLPPDVLSKVGASSTCKKNDGRCIVEHSSLPDGEKKEILRKYFRPKQPTEWKKKFDTWLTSEDIEKVMKQYEDAYSHFKFIGVVPIDFSAQDPYNKTVKKCISQQVCSVDLKSERSAGKTVLGAVFNLDPHYKGGSHWVGLVIDLKKNMTYYFDSYGMKPPKQIAHYMRYLTIQNPT